MCNGELPLFSQVEDTRNRGRPRFSRCTSVTFSSFIAHFCLTSSSKFPNFLRIHMSLSDALTHLSEIPESNPYKRVTIPPHFPSFCPTLLYIDRVSLVSRLSSLKASRGSRPFAIFVQGSTSTAPKEPTTREKIPIREHFKTVGVAPIKEIISFIQQHLLLLQLTKTSSPKVTITRS